MPFWSDAGKTENYKAKLEHKMCIAKETPESSFDLADCNLSEVPSGVFSMCRVFLKESLILENNNLTSLHHGGSLTDLSRLMILNLKNNRLSSLREDIGCLSNLQELNLENNHLKKLPDSFEKLSNLRRLNLKGNKLVVFPPPICSLQNLDSLNVCDNPKIKTLPKDLCNLVLLTCLDFDIEQITYPSADISEGGIESVMKFLSSESGKEYVPASSPCIVHASDVDQPSDLGDDSSSLTASYQLYQKAKDKKQKDLLMMEEALKQNYEIQSYSAAEANLRRQKLLEDLFQEQERMENEIMLLQTRKEKEKQTLLDLITKIESHSANLIKHLMQLNDRTQNLDKMLAVLEKDRLENEEIFTVKQEELEQLRKKEILEAMTEMLQQEETQRKYEMEKENIVAKLQNEENESNQKLFNLFQDREIDQQIFINKLLEEEEFQKQAFEALQLQKDQQHKEIAHQIHLIEKELSSLTAAELKKKDLKLSSEINTLAEHRTALAYLLTDLLSAKEKRENELKERLNQMESQRLNEMEDFWLIQYQKLMDRKPKSIAAAEIKVDPALRMILEETNSLDFLPIFAAKHIALGDLISFTISDMKKLGILDEDLCQIIIDKAWKYSKSEEKPEFSWLSESELPSFPIPSAPSPEEEPLSPVEMLNPTAPLLSPGEELNIWCQTECVICLDKQSTAVFLPCGHVCCCQSCYTAVDLCPMCRSTIISKSLLIF